MYVQPCKIITIPIVLAKISTNKKEIQKECHKAYTNYVSTLVNDDDNVNKNYGPSLKARGKITAVLHHFYKHNNKI